MRDWHYSDLLNTEQPSTNTMFFFPVFTESALLISALYHTLTCAVAAVISHLCSRHCDDSSVTHFPY